MAEVKDLLERKRELLAAVEEEQSARRKLITCLKAIGASACSAGKACGEGTGAVAANGIEAVLDELLSKKAGALTYEKQLFIECQNAKEALRKAAQGADATAAPPAAAVIPGAAVASPASGSRAATASPAPSEASKSPGAQHSGSPAAGGADGPGTAASQIAKLRPSVLGLLKFHQLITHLKENEAADHAWNLRVILDRLATLKKVTMESVKETGAGKIIARLAKHRLREIKERAGKVMAHWKSCMQASKSKPVLVRQSSSERERERERQRGPVRPRPADKAARPSDKAARPVDNTPPPSSSSSSSSKLANKAARPAAGGSGKPRRPDGKARKSEKSLSRKSSTKRSRRGSGSDSDSEGYEDAGKLDDDEWFRQRRKHLAASYERVEREEEYSRLMGDQEDDEALLEEIRRKKRLKAKA